jgi:hypothetical protein
LLDSISSSELGEWYAFHSLEPFGPERSDQHFGTLAALIGNIHRDRKKQPKAFTWTDFFPRIKKRKVQTQEEMMAVLQQFPSKE